MTTLNICYVQIYRPIVLRAKLDKSKMTVNYDALTEWLRAIYNYFVCQHIIRLTSFCWDYLLADLEIIAPFSSFRLYFPVKFHTCPSPITRNDSGDSRRSSTLFDLICSLIIYPTSATNQSEPRRQRDTCSSLCIADDSKNGGVLLASAASSHFGVLTSADQCLRYRQGQGAIKLYSLAIYFK
jgi:hypothetical protein